MLHPKVSADKIFDIADEERGSKLLSKKRKKKL